MSHYRDIFVTPFEPQLWFAVFGMLSLIVFSVKLIGYLLQTYAEDDDEENLELTDSVFVWGVAIMAQQGYHVQPTSLSIRIVFLFGYITGLVCFIAYSAQIVSTLSVKMVPIHKPEDILTGGFQLYANPNNTPKAVINHILETQKLKTDSVYVDEREAILRIQNHRNIKQALVTEPDIFFTEAKALKCTDRYLCRTFSHLHLHRVPIKGGMFTKRKSPFIEWFNYAIIRMLERGLNHRFVYTYMRKSWVVCLDDQTASVKQVAIIDIWSAFHLLIAGHLASLLLLCCELAISYRQKYYERNNQKPNETFLGYMM